MTAEIRDITDSDADQLLALWKTTWTSTYGPSLGARALAAMLKELELNRMSGMLPGNGERGLCVVIGSEIVGSLIVAARGKKAYIWGLYIKPEHQKRGFGARLLAAAVRKLEPEIEIEVRVLVTSEPAMFFYEKHGFVEIGTETTELPGDVIVSTIVMATSVEGIRNAMVTRK